MIRLSALTKAALLLAFGGFSLQSEAAVVTEITQFTDDEMSHIIAVATDNSDNFIAALDDDDIIYGTFSAAGTAWSPLVPLSNPAHVSSFPDVAMDATGTGLAIWIRNDGVNNNIDTSLFNNGIWTAIAPPLETTVENLLSPSIAMDGTGRGVAAWVNRLGQEIHASFYSNGVWTPFQTVGTANNGVKVVYSTNGEAAVAGTHFDIGISDLWANAFNGTSWQTATLLDSQASSFPDLGIDANGNAIVIWTGLANLVEFSRFDGTSWSTQQTISTETGNGIPHIAVAQDGTAVAVWPDSADAIQMSLFNGTTWSLPTPIAQGTQVAITMDSKGDALIGWVTSLNQLFTALLPKDGTIGAPVFIKTIPANMVESLDLSLSSRSTLGAVVWVEDGEGGNSFGTFIAFGPTPPTSIEADVCVIHGLSCVNIITWTPSLDPTTVAYNVRRNGVLVAIIPATGPFIFFDPNRCKKTPDTYSVTAVNSDGLESLPVTVIVK